MKRLLATLLIIPFFASGLAIASETTGTIGTGGGLEGSSGISGTVCPSTVSVTKPANVVATPVSSSSINVSWSSASGATAYRVYRATDASFTTGTTKIYDGSSLSYAHTSLPAATTYYYKVNAVYSACGSNIESSFASQPVSARTDAVPVTLSNSSSDIVISQELVDGGFTNSGGTLVGSIPLTLSESGTLAVNVRFVSSNAVTSANDSATASVDIGSGTVFGMSGSTFTGTISPPVFQSVSVASSLSATKTVVSVVKIGSESGSVTFSSPVTVSIPAPGLSVGSSVSIDYSLDGSTWQTLTGGSVQLISGVPYVVFTTTHFTYFSVGTTLPVCTSSDFSIGAWSSCSGTSQTRSVSLLPGASCNSSAYTPVTTQSCSSSSSSGGGGGGGGSGGGSSSSLKTPVSTTSTGTSTTPSATIAPPAATAPREFPTNILTLDRPVASRLDRPGILQLDLPQTDAENIYVQLTASGSIVLRAMTGATLAAVIPPNTTISSDSDWDGTIMPPIVRSSRDDRVVLEVWNASHTLSFDRDVKLEVPLSLADGAMVDIYVSTDGKNFSLHKAGVSVQNGKVEFLTQHFSYYLLRTAVAAEVPAPTVSGFSDIDNSFARDYIIRLTGMGAINGYDDGTFRPDRPASRAEFLKIALKALGIKVESVTSTRFSDVAESWQIPVVETAAKLGIVSGQIVGDTRVFRPNDSITRAEALKILLSAAKITTNANAVSPFSDVTDAWAIPYVAKARELGIVSGQIVGDTRVFRPNDSITRAEVTKIVVMTIDL